MDRPADVQPEGTNTHHCSSPAVIGLAAAGCADADAAAAAAGSVIPAERQGEKAVQLHVIPEDNDACKSHEQQMTVLVSNFLQNPSS